MSSPTSDAGAGQPIEAGGASQLLHLLTSYTPDRDWTEPVDDPRIVRDLQVNDLDRLPFWHKHYRDGLPSVPLPREWPAMPAPATAVLAGTAVTERAGLDLAGLARLLFLSAGVVRTSRRGDRIFHFRAAGSAGGRFPLEIYVAVPEQAAVPDQLAVPEQVAVPDQLAVPAGVHWYDPAEHALVQVAPPPTGSAPALVLTGVPWRTGWRYRERGFRHVYWDAGTLLSQQLALAESAGLAPRLYSRFPDDELSALVGADGVHEFPVAVLAFGDTAPDLVAGGPAVGGQLDSEPLEFPLITATQHAGDLASWGSAWPAGEPVDIAGGNLDTDETLDAVVLRRGSQRRMDPAGRLQLALLRDAMTVALRGIDLPHRIIVHAVDGLEPGLYRWPELDRPVRSGSYREEAYRVSLDQGLTRDAAFVVIAVADVARLSDREYREAQLAAGVVEGRLHLLAYAAGASATGMTFLDSEIAGLLGEPLDALLFTCVGVPEYTSTPGGRPGAPTEVRQILPR